MSSLFKKRYGSIANPCKSIFIKIPQSTILLLNGSPHLQIPHGGFSRQVAPRRWWHSSKEIHRNRRRKKNREDSKVIKCGKRGLVKAHLLMVKKDTVSCVCNFRICPDIQKSWHNFSCLLGHIPIFQTFYGDTLKNKQKQLCSSSLIVLINSWISWWLVFFLDYFDRVCTGGISTISAAGPQTDGIFKWTWILSDWFNIRGTNI